MCKVYLYCLVLCFLGIGAEKICKVPNGGGGICTDISKCPPLNDLDNKPFKSDAEDSLLRQSMCGSSWSPIVKVCCPQQSEWVNFRILPILYPGSTEPNIVEKQDPKPQGTLVPTKVDKQDPKPLILTLSGEPKDPDIDNIDKIYNVIGIKEDFTKIPDGTYGIDSSSGNKIYEKICKVPNGGGGICTDISKCPPLNDLDNKPFKSDAEDSLLRQSMCGSSWSPIVKVCCPQQSEWVNFRILPILYPGSTEPNIVEKQDPKPQGTLVPTKVDKQDPKPLILTLSGEPKDPDIDNIDKIYNVNGIKEDFTKIPDGTCGIDSSSGNKIYGGEATNIDQYPWLVLLEYSGGLLLCGGSLISDRFILTAAHCINGIMGPPAFARLGEYNTTSYPTDYVDTDGGGVDMANVTIIPVERSLTHPEYNLTMRIHDIGMLKLSRSAVYSDFIKTICLPTMDLLPLFNRNTNFTVAGWGSDENSDFSEVKKHVILPYVSEEYCRESYTELPLLNVVCAGAEAGRDSCQGDSGGPLMYEINQTYYIAVGVLSFGYRYCGIEGHPGVYINVFKYLKWINDVMEGRIEMH